jgi:hypothetical protein
MIYSIQAETYPSAAAMVEAYAARRARLMGKAPETRKAPCLTLVSPTAVVKAAPTLINAVGSPKRKRRHDADDHVWSYRVHLLQNNPHRTPTDHARMRCYEARVSFELLKSATRSHNLLPLRNQIAWELRQLGLSYPAIGRILNREHTAIIHNVRKIDAERGCPKALAWVERKLRQSQESLDRSKGKAAG